MKLFSLFNKSVTVQYQNQLCSTTTFVIGALILAAFVVPYYVLVTVKSGVLWDNYHLVYEQPRVAFLYQYLFLAELENGEERSTTVVTCSSYDTYNKATEQLQQCTGVRVIPTDSNLDRSLDHLVVGISFDLPEPTSQLRQYTMYFFLEAKLKSQCSFEVPAFASLEKVPAPRKLQSGTIVHEGYLQATQVTALQCPFFMRNIKSHFNHRYYPNENTTMEGFRVSSIRERIHSLNPAYYEFHSKHRTWKPDDSEAIYIEMKMSIGGDDSRETALLYNTSVWWKVSQFWTSYFPLLLMSLWVVEKVKRYLFENFYLRALEVMPWKEKYD